MENERNYYERGGIEAIDVIDAWNLSFNLGNVLKYIARAGYKTEEQLEDLGKAKYYIAREISKLQHGSPEIK